MLDVGCGQGEYLAHFGPGSVGLELQDEAVDRAGAKGLDVRQADVTSGVPQELRDQFDAVWCSNILEHVLRPHEFLNGVRGPLRPGGVFLAVVPMTRLAAVGRPGIRSGVPTLDALFVIPLLLTPGREACRARLSP